MILIIPHYYEPPSILSIINNIHYRLRSILSIHPVYRKQIFKVLLLNFSKQIISSSEVAEFNLTKHPNVVGTSENKILFNEINQIISNIIIVNIHDVNTSIDENNPVVDAIKKISGPDKIVFIGERIRPTFLNILLSFDNLVGFHCGLKSMVICYEEINSPRRYLEMIIQLYKKTDRIFDSNTNENFLFYNKIHKDLKKKKLFFYGGDRFLSDRIVTGYISKRNFTVCDCIGGVYHLIKNDFGYIIDNFDCLSPNSRSELIYKLMTAEYKNHTIILRSRSYLDDSSLVHFAKMQVPSIEMIIKDIPLIFYEIIKEKAVHKEFILNKNLWLKYLKSSALVPLYKSLESIYELELLLDNVMNGSEKKIDPGMHEFWYELLNTEKLEFVQDQLIKSKIHREIISTNALLEHIQKIKTDNLNNKKVVNEINSEIKDADDNRDWIKFQHLKGERYWHIASNTRKEYKRCRYNGSKGVKYLAYLSKYYSHPESISPEKLVKKVNLWNNDNEGKIYTTTLTHLIEISIRNDLKKISTSITHYIDCFEISAKCSYDSQSNERIIIEDEEMPPKD